jgi:hypothetical protein
MKEAFVDAYEDTAGRGQQRGWRHMDMGSTDRTGEMLKKDRYNKIKAIKEIAALKDRVPLNILFPFLKMKVKS